MTRIGRALEALCLGATAWVLSLMYSSPADAQSFPPQYANLLRSASYTVYAGDVNGDGLIDLLPPAQAIFCSRRLRGPFSHTSEAEEPPVRPVVGFRHVLIDGEPQRLVPKQHGVAAQQLFHVLWRHSRNRKR